MEHHEHKADPSELSIWFFCGILVLAYGIVLVITGLLEFHSPPRNEVLLPWLQPLHPTLWWGLLMAVLGGIYTVKFRPRRPAAPRS